jgi:hypothetical protein
MVLRRVRVLLSSASIPSGIYITDDYAFDPASPSGMQQISLNFEDPLSSYDYPRSNLETIAEKELSSLCSNWTLKGVEDLRKWYSVNVDSLNQELSDLLSKKPKKSKTMSSVASTNATGQTDRENVNTTTHCVGCKFALYMVHTWRTVLCLTRGYHPMKRNTLRNGARDWRENM